MLIERMRVVVARSFGRDVITDTKITKALLAALKNDRSSDVRAATIHSLAKADMQKNPEIIPILLEILADPHEQEKVRSEAAQSLGEADMTKNPLIKKALIEALNNTYQSCVRLAAVRSLAKAVITDLEVIQEFFTSLKRETNEELHTVIKQGLAKTDMKNPEIVKVICKALKHDWTAQTRADIEENLKRLDLTNPKIIHTLLEVLKDPGKRSVQIAVTNILVQIDGKVLAQKDPFLAASVLLAVGQIQPGKFLFTAQNLLAESL